MTRAWKSTHLLTLKSAMQSARIVLHIEREMSLHLDYCASFGLTKKDIESFPETLGTQPFSPSLLIVIWHKARIFKIDSMHGIQQIHPRRGPIGRLARITDGSSAMLDRIRRHRQQTLHGEGHPSRGEPILEVDWELCRGWLYRGCPVGIGYVSSFFLLFFSF